jgi:hypothetical protein
LGGGGGGTLCVWLKINIFWHEAEGMKYISSRIWGSHGVDYEDGWLQGATTQKTAVFEIHFSLIWSLIERKNFKTNQLTSLKESLRSELLRSARQDIPRLLCNPKVHHRVHNSALSVPIVSHMNPIHTLQPYFPKIYFNFILLSTPRSPRRYLPIRLSNRNFVLISHLSFACFMPRPYHSPWVYSWWLQIMKFLIVQFSPASCHFVSLRFKHSKHPVLKKFKANTNFWLDRTVSIISSS